MFDYFEDDDTLEVAREKWKKECRKHGVNPMSDISLNKMEFYDSYDSVSKSDEKNSGVIFERSYTLALEMAINILETIHNSGKRVTKFYINEVKKGDGRCYYSVIWE